MTRGAAAGLRLAALLVPLLVAACGKPVDPATARAACAADVRVYEVLKQDAALTGVIGSSTPVTGGVAPEYDTFTGQCGTNFLAVRWRDVTLPPEQAMSVLVQRLVAEGWRETTGPGVLHPTPCASPSTKCVILPPAGLLRGFRLPLGNDVMKLRIEFDPAARSLQAVGERAHIP